MKNPPNITVDPVAVQAANLLNLAADILVLQGWGKFWVGEAGQPKCVEGAINYALNGNPSLDVDDEPHGIVAYQALYQAIYGDPSHGVPIGAICNWNNNQKEASVVINKMREAAQSLVPTT